TLCFLILPVHLIRYNQAGLLTVYVTLEKQSFLNHTPQIFYNKTLGLFHLSCQILNLTISPLSQHPAVTVITLYFSQCPASENQHDNTPDKQRQHNGGSNKYRSSLFFGCDKKCQQY